MNIQLSNSFNNNNNLNFLRNKANSKINFGNQIEFLPSSIPIPSKKKLTISSIVATGTLFSMVLLAKHQKKGLKFNSFKNIKEIFKLKYGVKEMTLVSGASIASGVAAGIYVDKFHNKTHKIKEGVFQFLNATLPTAIVGVIVNGLEKSKKFNNTPAKIAGIGTGLIGGMPVAACIANTINDPNDLEPDRKIGFKDILVNMDDALGALVLAKIPIVEKIHAERLLPAVFAWCGYRAGTEK